MNYQILSIINVFGLTIGLASSLIIYLYISRELSYDKFNKDYEQIYRIGVKGKLRGAELNQAISAPPMANILKTQFPDITETVRIGRYGAWLVTYNNVKYNEDNLLFADSTFFNIFSFKLLRGDSKTALAKPNSIILTESAVTKYFGTEDPMGKLLKIENDTTYYKVTGVMQDIPANSHLHFDMLASIITLKKALHDYWISHSVYTYFKVKKGTDINVLSDSINTLVGKYVVPQLTDFLGLNSKDFISAGNSYNFILQPLADIHLKSHLSAELEQNGNITYIYIFSGLAILLIIIACINFMNLSTARAAQRAREVGIRKMAGSGKSALIRQFLTESVLLSLLAMTMALLVVEIVLPHFNKYIDLNLSVNQLANYSSIAILLIFSVIIGLLAGIYPAYFLASYQPAPVLSNKMVYESGNIKFRKGLVFFQFSVSIFFIIVTFVLFDQYKYLTNKDLGFDKKDLLIIRRSDAMKENMHKFISDVLVNPSVNSVSYSNSIPGKQFMKSSFILDNNSSGTTLLMNILFVSNHFNETYGLKMIKGKFFPEDSAAFSPLCVVNESAARLIGFDNILGRKLKVPMTKEEKGKIKEEYEIIGVVNDFNFTYLEENIGPLVMLIMPEKWEGYISVNIAPENISKTEDFLKMTWEKYTTAYPFVSYMLADELTSGYSLVEKSGKIFSIFSIIAILVAFMGLYGLVLFTANLRTKEVGIRKILGSSIIRITILLVKETLILISSAAIIAGLIAYFSARWWLNDFYFHVKLKPDYFIGSAFVILVIAAITVIFQVSGTARLYPGKVLKYE